jgi:lactoylglutathione lyase
MRIEHIAIWTPDIEKLRAFYETFFSTVAGERYTNPLTGFSSYFLEFDGWARLELMQLPGIPFTANDRYKQFTGLVHIAISVGSKEEVDALTGRIREHGFEVAGEPRTTGDGYYESVVFDPDGNRIEITV